jgi:hypothetical protein
MKDSIVEEVRRARDEYAKKHHYDLDAICEDLRKQQNLNGRKVISFPPKKVRQIS